MYNPYDSGRAVGKALATQLLTEQSKKRVIAVYAGRFQPFHKGHYSVYKHLVQKFGANNVYIGTSNVTDASKSPFSFREKKEIISTMFNIPANKIQQVKSPFAPEEILNKFPEDSTAFVTAFSEKDGGRLGGKYYQKLPSNTSNLEGYRDRGYFIVAPVFKLSIAGKNISGTQIRAVLGDPKSSFDAKKKMFQKLYGTMHPKIFKLMITKLGGSRNESILLEGVHDPGILKAVILAGGPGAGKGYVSRQLFGIPPGASFAESGMKVLNSDRVLEHLLKKEGLPLDLATLQQTDPEMYARVTDNDDPNSLMNKARRINKALWNRYTEERLGIIIDGTGAKLDKAQSQLDNLRKLGYDVKMTFVQTPLEVAQERNHNRERRLSRDIVEKLWHKTNANLAKFKEMFGEENVQVVTNVGESVADDVLKVAAAHVNSPVQNPVGKKWIVDEKRKIAGRGKERETTARKSQATGKVRNPKTGRDILVKTALGYEKGHPARKAAMSKSEAITIDVEVGDTILTGKFKNKKTVVKDIGTDDHDMPTINGRKAATFRKSKSVKNENRKRVKLVSEGGAAGHMAHPFEDMDLTFGDLKQLISLGLDGNLNVESPVTEKLDGQNISVSYRPDRGVLFARNKGHMKNKGVTALDVDGIKQMFAGRGDISDAFTLSAKDLDSAIKKLTKAQQEKVFQNGSSWISLEIIFHATQNVIPYGHNMLVFHHTFEVDDNGNAIGVNSDGGRMLAGMIKQINQHVQKTFTFGGPVVVNLPKSKNFGRRKGHYTGRVTRLQNQFKLRDNDSVMMWHQLWWEDFIDTRAAKLRYRMPNNVRQGLLKRWAFQELGSYSIAAMRNEIVNKNTVEDPEAQKFLDWALSFDKKGKADQFKKNIAPFERIFLQLGAEIMMNVKDLLTVSPGNAAKALRKELDATIKELQKGTDVKKMVKVKQQLAKLNSIGLDRVVPTEGIVFMFKGKLFKFTGTFAPINQLIGILKFG